MSADARVIRGRILTFSDDPEAAGSPARVYLEDGAVLVADGRIEAVGEAREVLASAPPGAAIDDHSGCLVMPGFIDAHIHYPQTRVIGSYGAQLLDWLHNYTFVEEQKFADPAHCARIAAFFLDELLRCGTTTAMVYCTVHPQSVDAFFTEAALRGARMIAGKVMMDRDAPEALMDTARRGYDESKALIERWRGRGRLGYAITPRFAVTSTQEQLEAAGALAREFPEAYVQTHLDENEAEIKLVAKRFPDAKSYLDVYDRAGLLGPRSVFGHCIHMRRRRSRRDGGEPVGRGLLPNVQFVSGLGPVRSGSASQRGGSRRAAPQMSAAERAIRCCAPRPRVTRFSSSTGSPGRRRKPSID